MSKKPLEPLIPLEQFKKLVAAIARVPKNVVDRAERLKSEGPKKKSG
jgi:hypothetical protein